jgi:hypothetical protein
MEDLLDLYAEPYDPRRPVIGLDELSRQLLADVRAPLPMQPGKIAREDYEYERHGAKNLFLWCEPLQGKRHVEVTDHRTMRDWAHCIKDLVDVHYPDAEVIRLVIDNLNTHRLASLYVTFPPAEARRIARKLEMHYTPKHGSWLNIAEIELAVLVNQCLDRRMEDDEMLRTEASAWEADRNAECVTVNWHFTTDRARNKLKHLYPSYSA